MVSFFFFLQIIAINPEFINDALLLSPFHSFKTDFPHPRKDIFFAVQHLMLLNSPPPIAILIYTYAIDDVIK
ncbi:hypothetical protein CHH53_10945 [Terribacillus sp. 7520-G]|nr:hypothetical protein CHH53_10945 [Terribacillus sp. 7520-G]